VNEQQIADVFTQQLDRMLLGQEPALAAEFSDLQELLTLGEQISRVNFQPDAAMQTAFQSQLATWFGSAPNGVATLLGSAKIWLLIISTVVVIGAALGLAGLPGTLFDSSGSQPDELPIIDAEGLPTVAPFSTIEAIGLPGPGGPVDTAPPASATPAIEPTKAVSTQGDIIKPTTSSLGDTLPTAPPSLGETLLQPTAVPTATQEVDLTAGETVNGGDRSGQEAGEAPAAGTDDDRGHGNEPDGYDEENPGVSEGIPDEGGTEPGQGSSSGGLNPGDFSRGNDGSGGGGGPGEPGGQGNGQGRGRGGGQGKGKGGGNN
jgi:hypothetical protein